MNDLNSSRKTFPFKLARANPQITFPFQVMPLYPLDKEAQARVAYGSVAEGITCSVLSLRKIPINGKADICFDAEVGKFFFEIKSVKSTGKVIIYDYRMKREVKVRNVFYAILTHRVKSHKDPSTLFQTFIDNGLELFIAPAKIIKKTALECPLVTVEHENHKATGYNRVGYREGYRALPVKKLRNILPVTSERKFRIYGLNGTVTVHGELPHDPDLLL